MKRLLVCLAACSSSSTAPPLDTPFPDAPAGVLVPVGGGEDSAPAPGGARPRREVSGTLADGDLVWDETADVFVIADAVVPAGATLTIRGAHVVLGEHVDLRVEGTLDAMASLFSATSHWGGVTVLGEAALEDVWLVAGGDDPAQAFGHSGSQPVVFVDGGRLAMRGGGVIDAPGKGVSSRDAVVELADLLVARCDTGGEHEASEITVTGADFRELRGEDDNDGIYLRLGRATIRDSRFTGGDDDAIDHNGAELTVERTTIHGFAHEGVAASTGGTVTLRDVTITGCGQAVEAGYGAPELVLDHVTLEDNGVGVRFGDDYDMACTGHIAVDRSRVRGNDVDVRNHVNALGGPLEGAIEITCSQIGETPACDADVGARP